MEDIFLVVIPTEAGIQTINSIYYCFNGHFLRENGIIYSVGAKLSRTYHGENIMGFLNWIVFILVIIGALGVGLLEATGFNLVGIFGGATTVVNYLIGLAALWMLFTWWGKVGK